MTAGAGAPSLQWSGDRGPRARSRYRRRVVGAFVLVFLSGPAGSGQTPISDAAYPFLITRSEEARTTFYVYRDADSGLNHGFPSGLFPPGAATEIDAACVDDGTPPTGCSSDLDTLDRERGTVFRVTFEFTPGAPPEFAGVNFEEPEGWGGDPRGVGWDLGGATHLLLTARSPDGVSVQFGVGGQTTPFLAIPTEWTQFSIALADLGLSDPSDVHLLFQVITNDTNAPSGGTVLLDDVRFEPAPAVQAAVLGLPVGTETFGVVPRTEVDPGCVSLPPDQILRNLATIYETALTVLALLDRGEPEDLAVAQLLADTLTYALANDNEGDPLPPAPDGSLGLHSGYSSGDIRLRNDQAPGAGLAGQVRLAGFLAGPALCGPTGFCLLLDGATGGNNAFAMLALLAAYEELGRIEYLEAAREIGRWIVGNLTDTTGTGFGGYYLGYPDEGVPSPKPRVEGKSVENNADIFVAFRRLVEIEEGLGSSAAAALWRDRADVAGDFVMEMFDGASGCFLAGTVPVGTDPGPGIDPTGESRGGDVVNVFPFLDAQTFTLLALARSPRYAGRVDWRRPVRCVLDRFAKTATVTDDGSPVELQGFSLVEGTECGADGVAWEFTAQAVVTMRAADRLYQETGFAGEASHYQGELLQALNEAPFGDGAGLVASTLNEVLGPLLAPIDQCLQTPFQCIPERVGLAATTWAIFAERHLNPLRAPCVPEVVLEDRVLDAKAVFEACQRITVGPAVTVAAGGKVTLRTREVVVLREGFAVELGGELVVEADAAFEP